ncbi:protein of unknown function [Flagellimonas taeanensis]|uniref:DUF4907 domain-containing protein n=1 Tax=Flagellimonas taeanensis TaxID=1005926 RepID=A0A1M6X1C5_9FLAO|nr:DUF4907 domain-containing protein [Allomuricauda taeanensis]SFB98724.1 protein of unknown function [Allomuricauda taeanensis]SHK99649.1 protein of unknown function [Allomuricauda taeanensis]
MRRIFACLLVLSFLGCERTTSKEEVYVHAQLVQIDKEEWTYRIYLDAILFIQQDQIPGREGNHGFRTKKDAAKTADLIVKKLSLGQAPHVTQNELVKLGIAF